MAAKIGGGGYRSEREVIEELGSGYLAPSLGL